MQCYRRLMQTDGTFERLGAGNEKRKRRRVKDIHVQPPAVCVSQRQLRLKTMGNLRGDWGSTAAPDPVREKPLTAGG